MAPPARRHQPQQSRVAIKYILAAQRACNESEFQAIIEEVKRQALDATLPWKQQQGAVKILLRTIYPQDPVILAQSYDPEAKLNELRDLLRTLQEAKRQLSGEDLVYRPGEERCVSASYVVTTDPEPGPGPVEDGESPAEQEPEDNHGDDEDGADDHPDAP